MLKASTSPLHSINATDLLHGLIVAIGTPIIPILMASLNAHSFVFNWMVIGTTAAGAGLTYLVKEFFTTPA